MYVNTLTSDIFSEIAVWLLFEDIIVTADGLVVIATWPSVAPFTNMD